MRSSFSFLSVLLLLACGFCAPPALAQGVDVGALLDRYDPERLREQALTLPDYPSLLVFVSFSMPEQSLRDWHEQVSQAGGVLVMRGLAVETLEETHRHFRRVFGEHTGGYMIDPTLFRLYGVLKVPGRGGECKPIGILHAP